MSIAATIERALGELDSFLKAKDWMGRENEVVNLYCHRFLINVNSGPKILATQCGIEVAVCQLPGTNSKQLVRKDLVIWAHECETVWNSSFAPKNSPLAIIEWKVNTPQKCLADIDWLCRYTSVYPGILGYSVCAHIKKSRGIEYWRVERGEVVT